VSATQPTSAGEILAPLRARLDAPISPGELADMRATTERYAVDYLRRHGRGHPGDVPPVDYLPESFVEKLRLIAEVERLQTTLDTLMRFRPVSAPGLRA
jgi:hypothetical protein